MAFHLRAQVKHYEWGVPGALSNALGLEPSGRPEAELWWGNHPLAGCYIETHEGVEDFPLWLEKNHITFPLLVKLLAARKPLSIQVHPSEEQARCGFAREQAQGVPLDGRERTYRDKSSKPELIIALSDEFVALAGFADGATVRERIARWEGAGAPQFLALGMESVADDLRGPARRIVETMVNQNEVLAELEDWLASIDVSRLEPQTAAEVQLMQQVSSAHPHDEGILFVPLMHHVYLNRGEALFVPDREVHAYLRGFGLEVMLSSDNVVRAGLTSKYKDAESFMEVGNFNASAVPLVISPRENRHHYVYGGFAANFSVHRISFGSDKLFLTRPSVCFVESGVLRVSSSDETTFRRGDVALAFPGEKLALQSLDAIVWVVHEGSD